MSRTSRVGLLSALVVFVAIAGFGGWWVLSRPDLVPGCEPPPNEDTLLDAYEEESLLQVKPAGAERTNGPSRSEACHDPGEGTDTPYTTTSVTVGYRLPADMDLNALQALFDPAAAANGWTRGRSMDSTVVFFEAWAFYCKKVRGQPTILTATATGARPKDSGSSVGARNPRPPGDGAPAGLFVSIRPYNRDTCD